MAANQSITVNVGALSNAIAVAIQQASMLAVALVVVLRLYLLLRVRASESVVAC